MSEIVVGPLTDDPDGYDDDDVAMFYLTASDDELANEREYTESPEMTSEEVADTLSE